MVVTLEESGIVRLWDVRAGDKEQWKIDYKANDEDYGTQVGSITYPPSNMTGPDDKL